MTVRTKWLECIQVARPFKPRIVRIHQSQCEGNVCPDTSKSGWDTVPRLESLRWRLVLLKECHRASTAKDGTWKTIV